METFFVKKTGEPVSFGSVIKISTTYSSKYGEYTGTLEFSLTKDNVDSLIKDGILVKDNPKVPFTIEDCITALASNENWTYEKMLSYIQKLDEIYTPAAFNILLKTIAKKLDKQYPNHISESPEIWIVSLLNGKVGKVNKEDIKNFKNFAAFRTKEDAEFALKVLTPFIEDMYGESED